MADIAEQTRHQRAQHELRMALAWLGKGRKQRALTGFRAAFELQPNLERAAVELGKLLMDESNFGEAEDVYRRAVAVRPNDNLLHKGLVSALAQQGRLHDAFAHYGLVRRDDRSLALSDDALIVLCVVRNEALRLPFFLRYYRQHGAARFFFVDNGSTDGTLELLLAQPDTHIWATDFSFNAANFGAAWFEPILRSHAAGHWVATVDADELLAFPNYERRTLTDLCRSLEADRLRAFEAELLDMYSDRPIKDTRYSPGQDFRAVCSYFDRKWHHATFEHGGAFGDQVVHFGGARQRVFGWQGDYVLTKVPLLKYTPEVVLVGGQHSTSIPRAEVATERGALLHFKYFHTFGDYVQREVARGEHFGDAQQYRHYQVTIARDESVNMFDPAESVRYENSAQLVQLGIMRAKPAPSPAPIQPASAHIAPIEVSDRRPFWSVVISTYTRAQFVRQALTSVLDQAPDSDEMDIEVVNDGGDENLQSDIERIVRECAGDRARFTRFSPRHGQPEVFNECVRRARGRWIHLLHDDDWVLPGFYAALADGIARAPDVGMAFSRAAFADAAGHILRYSPLERKTPGVVDDWLKKIASFCRFPTPSAVVARHAYETVGGYSARARTAFDWDEWKRIALRFPVWYEPRVLAAYRFHAESLTHSLFETGEAFEDARAAIQLAREYLPAEQVERISQSALMAYADYALALASESLRKGNSSATVAFLREALRFSTSSHIVRRMVELLTQAPQT